MIRLGLQISQINIVLITVGHMSHASEGLLITSLLIFQKIGISVKDMK